MSLGRDQLIIAAANIKAGTPIRRAYRRQLGNLVNAANELISRLDAQANAAPQAFADSRPSQFSTFEAALPDVTIGNVDPDDAVP